MFRRALGYAVSTVLIFIAVHSVLATTGFNVLFEKFNGYIVALSYVVVFLFILLSTFAYLVHKNQMVTNIAPNVSSDLYGILADEIEVAYFKKNWSEVLKIGTVLSRPLWIMGKYKERSKIGEFVESAADYLGKNQIQAKSLIDDLGWTNFEIGQKQEAIQNIKRGLEISKCHGYPEIETKAWRHLSAIEIFGNGSRKVAGDYLNSAYKALANIQNKSIRQNHTLGLETNRALLILYLHSDGRQAAELLIGIKDKYKVKGDIDRYVKLLPFIAESYYLSSEVELAKSFYKNGLRRAIDEGRLDTQLRCEFGLGVVYFDLKERLKSKKHFYEARDIATRMPNKIFLEKTEQYLHLILGKDYE